ncbi:MAG: trigger factor [Verrucomicrobia bacterium]|nr:trigger factor [Verrucomicrobiota bacterium]
MNVTVENLAPCRKMMRFEIDAQAVDSAFATVTAQFQREVRLPGFRRGKAPRDMVLKTFTKQIDDEVKRKLISENYRKALNEQKLRVVGSPDVEEIQFGRGQPLQFAVTIETAPEFDLPDYKGLPVKRETASVTEEDIERAIGVLRDQHATYSDVARPAQMEDYVVVNYKGTSEGKPLTEIAPTARGLTEKTGFWLHIKTGAFIPGFAEQLTGAQAGERRTVTVDFPADFVAPALAGRKGIYDVEVVQVKERILPELNDELARQFGAENVDKLREGVRRDLENELKYKQTRHIRNQLVQALLNRVNFDLPETLVTNETRHVIYDIVRENQERGLTKEIIDKQKEEIYNVASNSAKDRIKVSFILGRIAEKEGIKVDQQEITKRILILAHQHQIKPEKLIKQLQERDGIGEIHDQILTSKVLDFLELNASVQEVPPGMTS